MAVEIEGVESFSDVEVGAFEIYLASAIARVAVFKFGKGITADYSFYAGAQAPTVELCFCVQITRFTIYGAVDVEVSVRHRMMGAIESVDMEPLLLEFTYAPDVLRHLSTSAEIEQIRAGL